MHYKSIVLELIQQTPELHERLKESRTLLSTLEQVADGLKERHEELKKQLTQARPSSSELLITSEALEMAVSELEAALRPDSPVDADDSPSLDAVMAYLRRHSLPA